MKRTPAVAGSFYPADPDELEKMVDAFTPNIKAMDAAGVISPHAGYVYSGAVAGKVFANVIVPKQCIVLSPNHTGIGKRAAIMRDGSWLMPNCEIPVDTILADQLISTCSVLKEDADAHAGEHSLEVQLPFMHKRQANLTIVPICISHINIDDCKKIAASIAKAVSMSPTPILIVASSDMNHYEDQPTTEKKDRLAIEQILKMDPEGLLSTCSKNRITMCGVIPSAVLLFACNALGRTNAKLIAHQTSGDVCGDYSAVVGYSGIIIS